MIRSSNGLIVVPCVALCMIAAWFMPAAAQIPQRELDVPQGTAVTGLAPNAVAFSRQTVWLADPIDKSRPVWSTLLGTSVSSVASDGQRYGTRYILQSDGGFYSFGVFQTTVYAPVQIGTVTPLTTTETFKRIIPSAMEVLSTTTGYRSYDGGRNWIPDTMGLGALPATDMWPDSTVGLITVSTGAAGGLFRRGVSDSSWRRDTSLALATLGKVFVDRRRRIFVGAGNAGMQGSTDLGKTWTRDTAGLGVRTITAFSDDAFGNVYVITDAGQRIYRTTNGGGSWTRYDAAIIPSYLDPIAATTFNAIGGDSILYCATVYGLFISSDQGVTWREHNAGMLAENIGAIVQAPGGRELASTDLGVFKREAGDTVWARVWPTTGYFAVGAIQRDPTNYYFQAQHSTNVATSPRVVYKSVDRGSTWSVDTAGLWFTKRQGIYFVDELGIQHIALSGTSSAKAFVYVKPVGQPWIVDTAGFVSTGASDAATVFASNTAGQLFLAGGFSGGNMWSRPIAGGTWATDTIGLDTNRILCMIRDRSGHMLAGGRVATITRRVAGRWSLIPSTPGIDPTCVAYQLATDSTGALVVGYRIPTFGPNGGVQSIAYPGAYVTGDTGITWHFLGLQNYAITNLQSFGDTTYAMIAGRGAFRLSSKFAPVLHVYTTQLTYGTVNIGEHVDLPIVLANIGTDTLRITSVTVDNPAFVPQWTSMAVAPGAKVQDTIRFSPLTAGNAFGHVSVSTNASPTPDNSVLLYGIGEASTLSLSARVLNFGSVHVDRSVAQTVTVQNHGSDTLHVTSIVATPGMYSAHPATLTIPPGRSAIDTLIFAPHLPGASSGVVVLTSSAASSPDTIRVSGAGTAPQLFVNSRVIRCGTTYLGTPALATVKITNRGTDTLTIASVTSTSPIFVVTLAAGPNASVVAPGAFVVDTITFTPTALDTSRGTLVIVSDASTSPDTLTMMGVGLSPDAVDEHLLPGVSVGDPFPNPSAAGTAIPFSLARAGHVSVTVHDALGRTVAVLDDATYAAGWHVVDVGAERLAVPAGVYFVVFRAGGIATTRRFTKAY